jgi:hypothetical protein
MSASVFPMQKVNNSYFAAVVARRSMSTGLVDLFTLRGEFPRR